MTTPESEWRWFGNAGHLCVADWCRFHLCTQIGPFLVSTVGEYVPEEAVREIHCHVRGIVLNGRGDERLADYMRQVGYQELGAKEYRDGVIGPGRTYETMVFRTTGEVCHEAGCGCGLPRINGESLDMRGYHTAGAATIGHLEFCRQYAAEEPPEVDAVDPQVPDPGTPSTRD